MKNRIKIAFTIDVDGDVSRRENGAYSNATWGIVDKLPLLKQTLQSSCVERRFKVTWFIRADNHIKALTGDSCWLYKTYCNFWTDMRNAGDELAWHPHLYRRSNDDWIQETDSISLRGLLRGLYSDISLTDWNPKCIRIGESYHDNSLMAVVEELNIAVDSTAIPGRKRQDEFKIIDWELTKNDAYFPSELDYRQSGDTNRNVLEIPMTSILTKAPYDSDPLLRYCNLSFKHECIKSGLQRAIEERQYIVMVLHPDEVFPVVDDKQYQNQLISYSKENLLMNLAFVRETCGKLNKTIDFCTLSELASAIHPNVKI